MPSLPDLPFYDDGQAAVTDMLVTNLNTSATYLYVSDDLGEDAQSDLHQSPDGEGIGSSTHTTFESGTITVQMDEADDTLPRVGHVLKLHGKYYIINGKVAPTRAKNQVVRVALPCVIARAPILTGLLTAAGPVLAVSATEDSAITAIDPAEVSNRTGGTMAYTAFVVADDGTKTALATGISGLSINASTGEITGTPDSTPSTAGSYNVKVLCAESISGKRTATGVAWIQFTISA